MTGMGQIQIPVKMLHFEEKEMVQMQFPKNITIMKIKERNEGEFGIPSHEQVVIFRGRKIATRGMSRKDEARQPLVTPDLEEIIEKSGEDGLQMSVVHHPYRVPGFLKKEKFEDINARLKTGANALHRAVRKCEIGVVEELLVNEEFLGVNKVDNSRSKQTALHAACCMRIREAVQAICDQPDSFTVLPAQDVDGRTALHFAAMWGDLEAIKPICYNPRFGRQAFALEDNNGYTALQYAKEWGHSEAAAMIEEAAATVPDLPDPEPEEAKEEETLQKVDEDDEEEEEEDEEEDEEENET
eukprot:TRINITY_DN12482_c1_g1_i1.p1 TRINITY_DN12482_c1_g1~~TRINITY_DN12482_c1_g1_i1.p1  ORF type:complete len:299 (-),score=76.56 TRINITY_DN12482_c1_g1_i1:380-1276(-)